MSSHPLFIDSTCAECGNWLEPADEFRPAVDWRCPLCADRCYVDIPV
ncbi:MAG: hypothetical protein ACYCW6_25800 [Candidatus Xenobia bacterium]